MASIRHDAQELGIISWSLLAQETATDASLSHLLKLVEQGVTNFDRTDPALSNLWPICESVYSHEGVLLYQDRVVVPSSLRPQLLKHLHAAHQGTSAMEHRARAIVFWPGMSKDIRATREGCADCNRNAPSQAATPPLPSSPPSTPFEAVFADFFDYGGRHYLVVGDRLSGWVEVLSSTAGTNLGGSAGLYAICAPSSQHLVCRKSSPATVDQSSQQGKQRISSAYGVYGTSSLLLAFHSPAAGQKLQ